MSSAQRAPPPPPPPPGECGRTNDQVAPPVDLLQMLIPQTDNVSPCSQVLPVVQLEPETADGASTGARRVLAMPPAVSGISGCYTTCRACAEERYVRQQQKQRDDVTRTKAATICRCPIQNKPTSVDKTAHGTSAGSVYLNYFRLANDSAASSTHIDQVRGNEKWPPSGRNKLQQPQSGSGTSGSLPRFIGNGRRLILTTATASQSEGDVDDKEDFYEDNVFDIKRNVPMTKYSNRSRLESTGFNNRMFSSSPWLCCHRFHRLCCDKPTPADRSKSLVMVAGSAGEPLDPKVVNMEDDSLQKTHSQWLRQGEPEMFVASSSDCGADRKRFGTTSLAAGEHSRQRKERHRRQTLFAVGLFVGLFVIAASLLTGFVLLWVPASGDRHRLSDSSGMAHHLINN